jgi:hypothetical protein
MKYYDIYIDGRFSGKMELSDNLEIANKQAIERMKYIGLDAVTNVKLEPRTN